MLIVSQEHHFNHSIAFISSNTSAKISTRSILGDKKNRTRDHEFIFALNKVTSLGLQFQPRSTTQLLVATTEDPKDSKEFEWQYWRITAWNQYNWKVAESSWQWKKVKSQSWIILSSAVWVVHPPATTCWLVVSWFLLRVWSSPLCLMVVKAGQMTSLE